ncbi:amidohydrolase [Thiolapillus sp.]
MLKTVIKTLLLSVIGSGVAMAAKSDLPKQTLYYGGDILTMEGDRPHYVEAVLVKEGKIIHAGKKADAVNNYAGETVKVDLKGKTMMPSFFDPHGHLLLTTLLVAYADLNPPPIGRIDSIAKLKQALIDYKTSHHLGSDDWIIGMNYDDTGMKEQRHPTRWDLDEVSKTNPIYIMHSSSHFAVANSRALEIAGITEKTPDPSGGKFLRDEKGRLTGVMSEGAAFKQVMLKITTPKPEVALAAVKKTLLERFAAQGITTAQECGGALEGFIKLMQLAAKQKMLPIDVIAYPNAEEIGLMHKYPPSGQYDNRFRIAGMKLVLDGSIQGYTAYLSKPYFKIPKEFEPEPAQCQVGDKAALLIDESPSTHEKSPPPKKSEGYRGKPNFDQPGLEKIVNQAFANDWHLMVHCNGDAAADMTLEAVEKALGKYPNPDHRTTIIHAQTMREDQLDKTRKLNMALTLFPSHVYYWGDRHAKLFLGPERTKRMDPMRSVIERGIPYTIHTDSPVTPTNLLDAVQFAVNRTSIGGKVYGADQAMTPYEALKAITINAAWQHREEKAKGSIVPGKVADLVILSANPLKVNKNEIRKIKVNETIKEGQTIYRTAAITGSNEDAHGCIGPAGYRWCARTARCERPWELAEKEKFEKSEEAFGSFCDSK